MECLFYYHKNMNAVKLLDSLYYIPGPTNTGIICDNENGVNQLYLVDSGNNRVEAEKIFSTIQELFPIEKGGFELKAIINTHSHADHAGGNAFIKEKTGCEVWISYGEAGSLMNPELQSMVVGGGHPLPQVDTAYLHAEKCVPDRIIGQNTIISLNNGGKISFKELPGHYIDMLGILYTDSNEKTVFFAGDAVFGQAHILKYWIPFLFDVEKFKNTLEMLSNSDYSWYIPSHGECVNRIQETTELNLIAILSTEHCVLSEIQKQPLTKSELIKRVADRNDIKFKVGQYALIECTLNAYLTYLMKKGKINVKIEDNQLVWFAE